MKKLMQIECEPKCGFLVRSHNEKEVVSIAKVHAKKVHNMSASDSNLKAMMKSA